MQADRQTDMQTDRHTDTLTVILCTPTILMHALTFSKNIHGICW